MSKLKKLLSKLHISTQNFLGYPVSKDFDIDEVLPFFQYPINNLGDPFVDSTYGVNSNELEREVVSYFASLFNAPEDNWWGYVTNGGSEGNLYSLYLAREKYPEGIVYYSDSTHYSVRKNLHVLNIPNITIKSQPNGEMDYQDLHQTISQHRNVPVIIVANIGTTMTEAVDDVSKIKAVLKNLAVQRSYIHCDGALGGIVNAHTPNAKKFDFSANVDSITLSGHKFIGSPIPSGVVIVKKANRDRIALSISYTGSLDTTITGSRNGHSPIILWNALQQFGEHGLKRRVQHCLNLAEYTLSVLKNNGVEAWKNPYAITVVLPPQSKTIQQRWQLATEESMSHIICMPNVTKEQINDVVNHIVNHGNLTFPEKDTNFTDEFSNTSNIFHV